MLPDSALAQVVPAIVVQVAVGAVATVPFARRPSLNTGLMALTLWLAGAVTIAGQPVIEPRGAVVSALSGSAEALILDDLLAVAWGLSGSFLYMYYLYPERMRRQRTLRGGLFIGHLLALLVLILLARPASVDPQVAREGLWFPVRVGMPPAALAYGLIGKSYIGDMQMWACIGCWQAMRRLPYSAMRVAIVFGFCVACAVFVQGLAVTVAQLRGQQFFAPPNGPRLVALWLSVGLLCPLAAFSVAGVLRRRQLLFLRRDLLALRQRLLRADTPVHEVGKGSSNWVSALAHPLADVDQLSVEIRDVITAHTQLPTEATALAGVWLWQPPRERTRQLSERDIALLLLGATILGVEYGVITPVPLDSPDIVFQQFEEDSDWNIPADACFLQAVERLLEGKAARSAHALARGGLNAIREQLQAATTMHDELSSDDTADSIPTLIERWIGSVETTESSDGALHGEESSANGQWAWWRLPAHDAD